jgi:hypothetical protein
VKTVRNEWSKWRKITSIKFDDADGKKQTLGVTATLCIKPETTKEG